MWWRWAAVHTAMASAELTWQPSSGKLAFALSRYTCSAESPQAFVLLHSSSALFCALRRTAQSLVMPIILIRYIILYCCQSHCCFVHLPGPSIGSHCLVLPQQKQQQQPHTSGHSALLPSDIVPVQENVASGAAAVADTPLVHTHHFQQALQGVAPSVSKKDQRVYDALRWQLRSSRGHLNPQVQFTFHHQKTDCGIWMMIAMFA